MGTDQPHRGFITSWPQFGGPAGLLLANVAVLVFSRISGDQFLVWGWRIPFLLSIVMVAIGLYIRLGILETPAFRRMVAEDRIERAPVIEVIKRQPRSIILSALARMAEQAPAYIYLAFIFAYGTQVCTSGSRLPAHLSHLRRHALALSPSRWPDTCRIASAASACI